MKRTIVICDNCKDTMPEGSPVTRITAGVGRPRTKDFCETCLGLLLNGTFVPVEALEAMGRMATQPGGEYEGDIDRAREKIAESIEQWAFGRDPRPLLTQAASLLAGRGGEHESGRKSPVAARQHGDLS